MQGRLLGPELLGDLSESLIDESDAVLQTRFADEQYLFFRQVFDRQAIEAVREEVFGRLLSVGEVEAPAADGIFTGVSHRESVKEGLGQFWRSVSSGQALRDVSHGAVAKDPVAYTHLQLPTKA